MIDFELRTKQRQRDEMKLQRIAFRRMEKADEGTFIGSDFEMLFMQKYGGRVVDKALTDEKGYVRFKGMVPMRVHFFKEKALCYLLTSKVKKEYKRVLFSSRNGAVICLL